MSSSARVAWIVVGLTALKATPASTIFPPSTHTAADAAAIAQSPARRSTFSWALPPPVLSGRRTSVSSSPSLTAVMYGPMWNSSSPTIRSPSGPRRTALPFSATQTALRSSAASPWHNEPPIVPRLRTTGSAITSSASRKIGKCSASTSESSNSTCRVSAPIATWPDSSRMYESSSRSLMSIRCSGLASRSFIIGSRLWPPAITRASGPSRFSDAIAPSTLLARSYSNGAGVCTVGPFRVLDGGVRPDHGRARHRLGALGTSTWVKRPRRRASVGGVAERGAVRAGGCNRCLASEPRERQRSLRVHLADPRGGDLGAVREVPEPLGGGARVQAVDQADRVLEPGLFY